MKAKEYKKEASLNEIKDYGLFSIVCINSRDAHEYFSGFDGINRIKVDHIIQEDTNDESRANEDILLLKRVKDYIEQKDISKRNNDFLWIVTDAEIWTKKQLQQLIRFCSCYKNIDIALSNPCFSVWLAYHHLYSLDSIKANTKEKFDAITAKSRKDGSAFNRYKYLTAINDAIKNASVNDINEDQLIPNQKTTKVYELANALIKRVGRNRFERLIINRLI